ncbi:MAG: DUF115 domain-containing protein [Rhodospirillales bacterium]|nr:DUF115 domain-containing protein [Rhodospirillales bacterium]
MNEQERQEIRKKNLAAFKEGAPALYERLINHKPATRLMVDQSGAMAVKKGGKTVYGAKEIKAAQDRASAHLKKPQVFLFDPIDPGGLDRYGNSFTGNVLTRAKKNGIGFAPSPTAWNSFFLIIFGIGLGQHLDELINGVEPTFVLFQESDLDLIYHSLETYRWDRLFARLLKKQGGLLFCPDDHPEFIPYYIMNMFTEFCAPGIDATQWFAEKDTPLSQGAMETISQKAAFFAKDRGFFFDESLMMRNTHANLKSGKEKLFFRADKIRSKTRAFVIGSGPSLDEAIPVIRENADNAIIISGGSSLRPLLVNGITPDFHIEIENLNLFTAIKQVADSHDLSTTCLLASTTIDPSIRQLFDNTLYFFRNIFSPFPLFCDDDWHCLRSPNPAIINAQFSLAIDSGIEDIYFIGTDFGTKGEGHHHSKDSILYTEQSFIKDRRQYDIPVPGNFGGTFYTSEDLRTSMSLIDATILKFGEGRRLFNCSEGALMEKVTPLRKEKLSLPPIPGGKAALVGEICGKSKVVTEKWFRESWNDNSMRHAINALSDALLGVFEGPDSFENNLYLANYMKLVGRGPFAVWKKRSAGLSIAYLFRGTLDHLFSAIAYYHKRLSDRARCGEFEALVHEEFSAVVEALRRDALSIVDDPADVPKRLTSKVWEKPVEEKPHSWGKVSRNAPCPCNSGKRYKHCHGKS